MSIQTILFILFLLFQGLVVVVGWYRKTARRRSMEAFSKELGLEYFHDGSIPLAIHGQLDSLDYSGVADCAGFLYADSGPTQMYLFDLYSPKSEQHNKFSVTSIVWRVETLRVPPFLIQPKSYNTFFSQYASETSLEKWVELNSRFRMDCDSREFVKEFLNLNIVDRLSSNRDIVVECVGELFCIHQKGKLISVSKLKEIMALGYELLARVERLSGEFVVEQEEEEEFDEEEIL